VLEFEDFYRILYRLYINDIVVDEVEVVFGLEKFMASVDVVVLYFLKDGGWNRLIGTFVHQIVVEGLLEILIDVEPF
jgi:hypothetical protein